MSSNQERLSSPSAEIFGEARRNWGWLLALGLASLLLGTLALGSLYALTLASVLLFGWLILVTGVFELVQTFKCRGWKSFLWQLLIALMHVVAGAFVIVNPLAAEGVLTLMLGLAILLGGAARTLVALQHRAHRGWGLALVSGVVGLALGLMILSGWPGSSIFVIGLFVAIELIMNGWSMIMLALAAKASEGVGIGAAKLPA